MARVNANLSVSIGDAKNLSIRGHYKTRNQDIKTQLEKLGYRFELYGNKDNEYYLCKIEELAGSDELIKVRSVLIGAGGKEAIRTIIPKEDRDTHFAFKYIRSFSKTDIDQAEFLRLNVKGLQRIADQVKKNEAGFVLKANRRLENKLDFGWLDTVIVPYVSENCREQLESEKFEGIHFEPAIFDQPEKVTKHLWQLTSILRMPHCLLSVQNNNGDTVTQECNEGARIWDDAGYVQPILKYSRVEVEAMGGFDIAKTRELIGNLPQHYHHQFIVSQRFRKHLEVMNIRSVDFVPVELVDV